MTKPHYPFKYQLIQGLDYNLTDADRLVSELSELLTEDCTDVLYNARNNVELTYVKILQSVNADDRLLFLEKQKCGVLGLFRIASNYSVAFRRILQSLRSAERMQLLKMKDSINRMSILQWAAVQSMDRGSEMLEVIFKSVSEEERYNLLQRDKELTLIHSACFHGDTRMLEVMIRLTKEEAWYKLLQIPDVHLRQTPLHWSASNNQTQAIKTIADSVTTLRMVYLLKVTENDGYTPLQLAKYGGKQAAAKLLQDYQTKALIDVAIQQTDATGTNIRLLYEYLSCLLVGYFPRLNQ